MRLQMLRNNTNSEVLKLVKKGLTTRNHMTTYTRLIGHVELCQWSVFCYTCIQLFCREVVCFFLSSFYNYYEYKL